MEDRLQPILRYFLTAYKLALIWSMVNTNNMIRVKRS